MGFTGWEDERGAFPCKSSPDEVEVPLSQTRLRPLVEQGGLVVGEDGRRLSLIDIFEITGDSVSFHVRQAKQTAGKKREEQREGKRTGSPHNTVI